MPTMKVSAESSLPGLPLSTWRSRKQGLSFSRKVACSGVSSIAWSAFVRSSASQRSCRVPQPLVVEDLLNGDRRDRARRAARNRRLFGAIIRLACSRPL
jgi:hypothetical protein